jgi:hypothetical protein
MLKTNLVEFSVDKSRWILEADGEARADPRGAPVPTVVQPREDGQAGVVGRKGTGVRAPSVEEQPHVGSLLLWGHKADTLAPEPSINEDRHRLWAALEDAKATHVTPFLLSFSARAPQLRGVQVGAPAADQGPVMRLVDAEWGQVSWGSPPPHGQGQHPGSLRAAVRMPGSKAPTAQASRLRGIPGQRPGVM